MKGENIFKRKDGRWEGRYVKSRELSGKIVYGYCYGRTYREVKEKVMQLKLFDISRPPAPSGGGARRLAYYCDEWLCSCKGRLKDSTCERYRTAVDRHIIPKLGACYPQAVTDEKAAEFSSILLAEGLAPKTVRDILNVLRLVLKFAAKQLPFGLPELSPEYPKEAKKEARVLSPEEQERLTAYLSKDMDCCKFGVILAMFTGLRIGELCALKWENISLRDRTVRVSATMQRLRSDGGAGRTEVVIGSPKSDLSSRVIPLSESAARLCKYMEIRDRSAYVLTGTSDFIEPRTLQYRLKKYTADCGLEGVHFHTLRHTFATRCIEAGFELKSLSEILGHATTAITMERYVHSSMKLKRENMRKLAAVGM